ncbi:hypothetical protein R3X28_19010 [Maribacter sp. TH_r10]|uniref:hypothetical protein n=1 Tax=Maribacter sp. TH_r10 TaxID=3082086 RepID=UPI002954E514|nr:hypothetical protein [Maribacter sp. TH_r10]MDV7140985.1 hypothetical protein [Maribacter sp. TH_r10]
MKKTITILILILSFKSSFSQKKELEPEVIKKAEFYLKKAVGEDLFEYFELASWYIEYYQHKSKAKKRIRKKNYTRKKKNYINIKKVGFNLNHPDFKYENISKYSTVILDFDLNLIEKIDIDYIPQFLLENKPSNWLNENKIDSIAETNKMKKGIKPITKTLTFDTKSKKYYWKVTNQLNEKSRYRCDMEVLEIHPVNGIVLKQYETEYNIHREF